MIKFLLYPFSVLFGIITSIRNSLYDFDVLKSKRFDVPIISIGNITVGGTGKTPHVEYLVSLLKDKFETAVLSRGYKRKSKGFIEVQADSKVTTVGDEPLQIKTKFPEVVVAVCENRATGVEKILSSQNIKTPDVFILDDAFQHRRISPDVNILLIDYNRPLKNDFLLPTGHLRESSNEIKRADIIIFTKCSGEITSIMRRIMKNEVCLKPYQELYFTTLEYGRITPVFSGKELHDEFIDKKNFAVLAVTGIASPVLIYKHIEKFSSQIETLKFPDHHNYSEKDISKIFGKFENIKSENKIIVTTEKDAMRFKSLGNLPEGFKESLYYLPFKVKFLNNEENLFNKKMLNYVGENKSNREIYKRKNKS